MKFSPTQSSKVKPLRHDKYRWMGFLSFASILLLSLLLSYGLLQNEKRQLYERLQSEAQWFANRIQSEFELRLKAIKRMANRWSEAGGTSRKIWDADAFAYINDMAGFQAIEWLDTDGRVRWIVPLEGNEKLLNTIPNKDPTRLMALEQARIEKREIVAGPIKLIQGGIGLLIFNPVYRNQNFDGFIVAVLRMEDLLTQLLMANPRGYSAKISVNTNTVFQTQEITEKLIDLDIVFPLRVGEADMQLQLFPDRTSYNSNNAILPWITLAAGIVIACFFLIIFWLWSITVRRADETLRANAKSQGLLNAIPDTIFQLDENNRFIDFHCGNSDDLTVPVDAFLGHTFEEVLPDQLAKKTQNAISEVMHQDTVNIIEYQLPNRNNNLQDYEARISKINTGGVLVIVRNISEQKRVNRLKQEFISTVSHELRTPLTSIRGALGLISGGAIGDIPPKMKDMITIALRNSEHLTLLINDILDIEKIEQGKMNFDFKTIEIMPIIEQSIANNQAYAQRLDVTLKIKQALPDCSVNVDSERLNQVLSNLLSNAAKFSPAESTIEVSVIKNKGLVRVEVRDYGRGIPVTFHDRIFSKFSQADSSDTRSQGGSGLGLAISKAIIEQMHGTIGFRSETQGTTFYFELPIV